MCTLFILGVLFVHTEYNFWSSVHNVHSVHSVHECARVCTSVHRVLMATSAHGVHKTTSECTKSVVLGVRKRLF
jgi:hypothetical protein